MNAPRSSPDRPGFPRVPPLRDVADTVGQSRLPDSFLFCLSRTMGEGTFTSKPEELT